MKIHRLIAIALLAGCGAADSTDTDRAPLPPMEQPGQPTGQKSRASADNGCPLALPGARLASEVTADGVALVFTSDGGDPAELRERVGRMVDRHNEAQVPVEPSEKDKGMSSGEGAHGMDMHHGGKHVPSRATVEDIANGVRVVFTPLDPAQVGVLREEMRVHGKEMASTHCYPPSQRTPAQAPPPSAGDKPAPPPVNEPSPTPKPDEPLLPDQPVTPDHPITPPNTPPTQPPPVAPPPGRHK